MPKRPRIDPSLVEEFVNVAHSDLARTQELLAQESELVNCAWDWGGGDWETGLGAAAHMGEKDIATFLLDNGARLDLFAAAMLGMDEVVRTALEADPRQARVRGPHGITLATHATKGGNKMLAAYIKKVVDAAPATGRSS